MTLFDHLEGLSSEFVRKLSAAKQDYEDLLAGHQSEVLSLQDQIVSLQTQNEQLLQQLSLSDQLSQTSSHNITSVEHENRNLRSRISQLQEEHSKVALNYDSEKQNFQTRITSLEAENSDLTVQILNLRKDVERLHGGSSSSKTHAVEPVNITKHVTTSVSKVSPVEPTTTTTQKPVSSSSSSKVSQLAHQLFVKTKQTSVVEIKHQSTPQANNIASLKSRIENQNTIKEPVVELKHQSTPQANNIASLKSRIENQNTIKDPVVEIKHQSTPQANNIASLKSRIENQNTIKEPVVEIKHQSTPQANNIASLKSRIENQNTIKDPVVEIKHQSTPQANNIASLKSRIENQNTIKDPVVEIKHQSTPQANNIASLKSRIENQNTIKDPVVEIKHQVVSKIKNTIKDPVVEIKHQSTPQANNIASLKSCIENQNTIKDPVVEIKHQSTPQSNRIASLQSNFNRAPNTSSSYSSPHKPTVDVHSSRTFEENTSPKSTAFTPVTKPITSPPHIYERPPSPVKEVLTPIDPSQIVIIDVGSRYVKFGFANEIPRVDYSLKGVPKYHKQGQPSAVFGDEALKSIYKTTWLAEGGNLIDFPSLLTYVIEQLEIDPSCYNCALLCSPTMDRDNQLACWSTLTCCFKGAALVPSPVASLYAVGLSSGFVLEVGASQSFCVGVENGSVVKDSFVSGGYSGTTLDHYFAQALSSRTSAIDFHSLIGQAVIRDIKEKYSFIDNDCSISEDVLFYLPDGTEIFIPGTILSEIPELLFSPNDFTSPGVLKMVSDAFDVSSDLPSDLVVTGATTLLPNFLERIENSLGSARVCTCDNHEHAAFYGASSMVNLPGFSDCWFSDSDVKKLSVDSVDEAICCAIESLF
ncbi:hypothetical protein RCL1_001352 [Eukaryota sp. TZLM3-RCL]